VDATGSTQVVHQLLAAMPPGGRLALVGLFHGGLQLDLNRLVEREIDVVGCSVFRDEMGQVLPMLDRLAPRLAQFASTPITLEEVPEAYRKLLAGEAQTIKTLIRP
jgi:(R,R)-butanediol dehydrogenase/meso-butanediol dehydrogenase/diacetyl reductase